MQVNGANMVNQKIKQITSVVIILALAIIFITSYVSFGTNAVTTATTTALPVQSYPVFGSVNAIILGYSNDSTVALSGNAINDSTEVSRLLSKLEANGSISFYPIGNSFSVTTNRINPSILMSLIYGAINLNDSSTVGNTIPGINVSTEALVKLPTYITVFYHTQKISAFVPNTNYSISITNPPQIGSTLVLKVKALITANGIIYDNQLNLSIS